MIERFVDQAANDQLVKEPADVALALRNLTAGYNGRVAITGLTGDFLKGSATAVIGPNGAGKSTLLKVVAGQIRAMAGDFACENARIAFLPQQADSYMRLMTYNANAILTGLGRPRLNGV